MNRFTFLVNYVEIISIQINRLKHVIINAYSFHVVAIRQLCRFMFNRLIFFTEVFQ